MTPGETRPALLTLTEDGTGRVLFSETVRMRETEPGRWENIHPVTTTPLLPADPDASKVHVRVVLRWLNPPDGR